MASSQGGGSMGWAGLIPRHGDAETGMNDTHTFTFTDEELDCLVDAMWRHDMEAHNAASMAAARGGSISNVVRQWQRVAQRLKVRFVEAQRAAESED